MTAEKLAYYLLEKLLEEIKLDGVNTTSININIFQRNTNEFIDIKKIKMTVFENEGCSAYFTKKMNI